MIQRRFVIGIAVVLAVVCWSIWSSGARSPGPPRYFPFGAVVSGQGFGIPGEVAAALWLIAFVAAILAWVWPSAPRWWIALPGLAITTLVFAYFVYGTIIPSFIPSVPNL